MTCLGFVGAILIVIGIGFTTGPISAVGTLAAIVLLWCIMKRYENRPS